MAVIQQTANDLFFKILKILLLFITAAKRALPHHLIVLTCIPIQSLAVIHHLLHPSRRWDVIPHSEQGSVQIGQYITIGIPYGFSIPYPHMKSIIAPAPFATSPSIAIRPKKPEPGRPATMEPALADSTGYAILRAVPDQYADI